MPLLSVQFPQATQFLYSLIVQISSFDILPLDLLKTSFFSFEEDDSSKLDDKAFNDLGYESFVAIENLGSWFYYLIAIVGIVVAVIIVRMLKNRFAR